MNMLQRSEPDRILYRSGAAARLAGLPVETLRIWERRYSLSDAERSAHGQRLYSAEQVARLSLLKQLVDQGHAIGVLAGLAREQLQAMLAAGAADARVASGPVPVLLVGPSLARRVAAERQPLGLDVRASCARLEQVAGLRAHNGGQVLVAEVSELDDSAMPLLAAAREAAGVAATVVLYRFCASATIRALRAQGYLVARMPAELGELALLCRSALAGQRLPSPEAPGPTVAPPRFDEEALATISAAGNRLSCECPRHITDILLMVGSFERYSANCANRNPEDARLHSMLERAAGQARVVLEEALTALALADGLPLPPARN
ncbi:MerR family transcriptional regulator [Massilia litorea]|jgi:DNA-binding transcriptional MerR regulator|uniref:MerR family transcriptional regulator n=1 Tax=Massilia litorea TaxID=2769491 RepID=A0A7L9U7W9_9BURK|nr:MerR family transcriptional regulator [Massilia litorea]QOL50265.1 MerR family transcriptional regulator [Massilia litorea]